MSKVFSMFVFCLSFSFTIPALVSAGEVQYTDIIGTVWSYDNQKVMIKDEQGKIWSVQRAVFKKGFELKPDQRIGVRVFPRQYKLYTPRN
jgi:hypothetical protein